MALTKITKSGLTDSAVDNNKIEADAVDATKIEDNAISEEHLDTTVITGNTELSEAANDSDVLLIYDASAGALKKVLRSNLVLQAPTFSSISPTNVNTGDGTGNATFTITGTNFGTGTTAKLLTSSSSDVAFDSVTRDSATQLTCVIAISSLSNANEPYGVQVLGGNGLNTAVQSGQVNINAQPVYVTSAGSLGSGRSGALSFSVNATDPESAGNVTFEIQSGSLPAGLSLTNTAAEGGTAIISGNATEVGSDTTSNFVLRAVDAASNTTSRAFSITINAPIVEVFNSSGTFSVPSGISSVQVLVVAGGGGGGDRHAGGGGAGGLIFMPEYPVTPSGTVSVTVGCGGSGGDPAALSPNGRGGTGQDSVFGTLTAKGGGYGAPGSPGGPGGSGGGGGHSGPSCVGGSATQPTQPGNSGAYGFGNAGGAKIGSSGVQGGAGAGGGGAGAVGGQSCSPTNIGGDGGDGRAYTIADGTTPVYYAGGGGGSDHGPSGSQAGGPGFGGQGGGGRGGSVATCAPGPSGRTPYTGPNTGVANRGGGGGGGTRSENPLCGGAGGKGVVIVRY
jgi:hypothetical protein